MSGKSNGFALWPRHPFWQAVALLVIAYLAFDWGIPYLPPLVGVPSAPVPKSVLIEFMSIALAGIMIYVSENESRHPFSLVRSIPRHRERSPSAARPCTSPGWKTPCERPVRCRTT